MEFDYFTLYLRRYLRDHGFDESDIESESVQDKVDAAWSTYESERKAGNSEIGATELAEKNLFVGIGLSRKEAAIDILEDYYKDRIEPLGLSAFDEWGNKLAGASSIWEAYQKENAIGLNEELVEEGKKGTLLNQIDQFLKDHGL